MYLSQFTLLKNTRKRVIFPRIEMLCSKNENVTFFELEEVCLPTLFCIKGPPESPLHDPWSLDSCPAQSKFDWKSFGKYVSTYCLFTPTALA